MNFGTQYGSLGKEKDDPPKIYSKKAEIMELPMLTAQNHIFSDTVF